MNTNEELKTRPDFEKLAEDHVAELYGYYNQYHIPDKIRFESYVKGCEYIWTTHGEPLQAENVALKKDNELIEQKYQRLVSICGDKEHEASQTADRFAGTCIRLTKELHAAESENQKLREALKENREVLDWHLGHLQPFHPSDQSDFFNMTANAISQADELLKTKTNP